MNTYTKNGLSIPYQVTYKHIKYTYFRIKDDYVSITTSPLTSMKQIHHILETRFEKFHHILTHIAQELKYEIRLWGHTYPIRIEHGRFRYVMEQDQYVIYSMTDDLHAIKKKVYLNELKTRLDQVLPKIHNVIDQDGLNPLPFRLKYLKSKYGSYHRKHQEITLNTYLATLDPIYLEYVIYHEYAHAVIFNHSKAFYNVLNRWMPNHKLFQKDLKKIAII